MRIAVLGGTGFIGSWVATLLVRSGHEVAVIHRGHGAVPSGALSIVAERADAPRWPPAWERFRAETLIDMVAYTPRDVEPVLAVLKSPLERLTVVSSGDVYASYGAFLRYEEWPANPASPTPESGPLRDSRYPYRAQATGSGEMLYDYEKIRVEEGYRSGSPVPVTVVRLPMVYGPGDPQGRVAKEVARLREAPFGVLELHPEEAAWRCTRGYVEDAAAAIALAATHPAASAQTYNAGEPHALSTREWLEAIARLSNPSVIIRETPAAAPSLPVDWRVPLTMATERIRAELGYSEPVGLRTGLLRTVRGMST
jgi:nucleoside-diphosphate-sugar epimerase